MKDAIAIALVVITVLALVVGINLGFAWVVWTAWTQVCVAAFHWPALTFWQVWWALLGLWVIGGFFKRGASSKND